MDGLGVPGLNVNIGQGPLGIALPIVVVVGILASTGTFLSWFLRLPPASRKERASEVYSAWFGLFLVSVLLGIVVINPLTGGGGLGVGLGILFGSYCVCWCTMTLGRLADAAEKPVYSVSEAAGA
jgi:hypothetical protein